jgi:hypothetical protein
MVSVLTSQVVQAQRRWSALQMFGGYGLTMLGNDINSLRNMIALERNVHEAFGNFRLWFRRDPLYR